MTETPYVEIPGDLVLRQPIALTGVTMYCWMLDASWSALNQLCDLVFNGRPSGWEYRPLLPACALVCADMARGQSRDPADHAKGGMPERDLGFWVPLVRGKRVGGRFEMAELVWYHPYLFIDNEVAFVVGRETYGFRKYLARCTMPTSASDPSTFTVETLYIEKYGPQATGTYGALWTLTGEGVRGELREEIESLEHLIDDAVGRLRARFAARTEELPVPTWELVERMIRDLVRGEVPMVFLRQLRDVARADRAAYQAIVEAPCKMTRWRGAGFLRPHTLEIKPVDSHPIVTQLGLRGQRIDTGLGWWIGLDFDMQNGATIWQAR